MNKVLRLTGATGTHEIEIGEDCLAYGISDYKLVLEEKGEVVVLENVVMWEVLDKGEIINA